MPCMSSWSALFDICPRHVVKTVFDSFNARVVQPSQWHIPEWVDADIRLLDSNTRNYFKSCHQVHPKPDRECWERRTTFVLCSWRTHTGCNIDSDLVAASIRNGSVPQCKLTLGRFHTKKLQSHQIAERFGTQVALSESTHQQLDILNLRYAILSSLRAAVNVSTFLQGWRDIENRHHGSILSTVGAIWNLINLFATTKLQQINSLVKKKSWNFVDKISSDLRSQTSAD